MDQIRQDFGALQVISGSGLLFNHCDTDDYMWSGDGDRQVRTEIKFAKRFRGIPNVQAGIIGVDCAHEQNVRYWLNVVDLTPAGFTLEFNAWNDTRVARAGASWIAMGRL